MLATGGAQPVDQLSFAATDLMADSGWTEAVAGCDFVLHVASPFPSGVPKHEDELIVPAREGALRVLRAARDAGVKRVVLTSSFAAIGYGHDARTRPFSEDDWTDPTRPHLSAYVKSKAIAERAAWDFVAREGGSLELTVVNPVAIFGPVLGPDFAASVEIVQRMMNGGMPACPRLTFGVVDVRDVADLHVRAMIDPAAKGERFLAIAGETMRLLQIAQVLRAQMGSAAHRVPARELPDWLLRIVALFDRRVAQIVPDLGKTKTATSEKARRILGWAPRSNEEAIVAAAAGESLVRFGLLKAV